jgi:hypothetical protein
MRLDFATGQAAMIGDPAVPLWITEGIKKVDALRSRGLCILGLMGTSSWRSRNLNSGIVALSDWEQVALNGRDVYIVFDSDVVTKAQVQSALTRLKRFLAQRGARVHVVLLPDNPGQKVGVDDSLVGHTLDELQALANQQPSEDVPLSTQMQHQYRATTRGLMWLKPTRDGDIAVSLPNFTARIMGDIVTDDGAETNRHYELEAAINGRTHRFTVAAPQFPSLGWVSEHLMALREGG